MNLRNGVLRSKFSLATATGIFIGSSMFGGTLLLFTSSAWAATDSNEASSIVVNGRVVSRGAMMTDDGVKYIPISMVCAALRTVNGSSIPNSSSEEFTVNATWNKMNDTLKIITPRYSKPLELPTLRSHAMTLEMDGFRFPHSLPELILSGGDSPSVSVNYMSRILGHLNIRSSLDKKGQWNWIAGPETSVDRWVSDTPPFDGHGVRWASHDKTIGAVTNGAVISGYMGPSVPRFASKNFAAIQSFQGRLDAKRFVVTIYEYAHSQAKLPLIGVRYGNKVVTAFSPGYGELYPVNFTSDDLVLRFQSDYSHWLSVNLRTGHVTMNDSVAKMSGYFYSVPKNVGVTVGPMYVLGLPHKFPSV